MPGRIAVLLLAASLAAIQPVEAQTARRASFQVSGLFEAFTVTDGGLFKPGPGFEAQLRYNPSAFSIGGGVQLTRHTHEITNEDVTFTGAFLEPRVVIDAGSERMAPYMALRFSWSSVAMDDHEGAGLDEGTSGMAINGGGGLLVNLGGPILELGGTYGVYKISGDNMQNLVVRVGLAFGL